MATSPLGAHDSRKHLLGLPKPAAPIPLQDPHPLPLQLRTGQILTTYAYLFLRLRCHHVPPPNRSMRTEDWNRAGSPKPVDTRRL
jgi:hypothetical protein